VVGIASEPLLVVLLGPTASGKTSLSLALARQFQAEIVSCDSVAVYQGLEIGSAKPSREQQSAIPHHLIDVVPPDAPYTAGDYSRAARAAIAGITARKKLPIVTGGAGLYLRALLAGLFAAPPRSTGLRSRLRCRAEIRGPLYLHHILARLDPASAGRIHVNDVPKVVRAIEVSLAGRRPMSEAWKSGRDPLTGYRILRIGLDPDRATLYRRIDARARAMFDQGLIEETKALLTRYRPPTHKEQAPALDSLGYRQAGEYLRGVLTREEAVAAASLGHRNYAKRQLTWFRREPEVAWLHGFGDDPAIQAEASRWIAREI
jgi:tRNA dimethylallyltransferase